MRSMLSLHQICNMAQEDDSLEAHQRIIDMRIKEGIDKLITSGDIRDEDFFANAEGDRMISINDEAGDIVIFNYTKERLYSYAGRLRD